MSGVKSINETGTTAPAHGREAYVGFSRGLERGTQGPDKRQKLYYGEEN